MEQKKCNPTLWALITAAAAVVLSLAEGLLAEVAVLASLVGLLIPLLFIAAVVFGYLSFKDNTAYAGKLVWLVIALQAGLTLRALGTVSQLLFALKAPALKIIAYALTAAAHGFLTLTLLDKRFTKWLPIGLGVLAVAALLDAAVVAIIVAILLYGALYLMTTQRSETFLRILRLVAIILAVVHSMTFGVFAAACWIILVFVLVPYKKLPAKPFNLAKLAGVVCVITAIVCLVAFLISKPTAAIDRINDQITQVQQSIQENAEQIVQLEKDLADYQKQLATAQDDLKKAESALETANTALQTAEDNLDTVCTRTYYSSWLCNYSSCYALHNAVSDFKATVNTALRAVDDCLADEETAKDNIERTENSIEDRKEENTRLAEQISRLRDQLPNQWLKLFVSAAAVLLAVAGLACLGYCLFTNRREQLILWSVAGIALSALLHILWNTIGAPVMATAFVRYVTNVNAWTIAIMTLLAVILVKKEGKLAKFRVMIIIASLIQGVLAIPYDAGIYVALFSLTMILVALALVPPVFTEYNTIAKHIFFSLISFGVWQLIWTYQVTKNLNKVAATEPRKPGCQLLLCMFLPFYYPFWLLKTAENVESYAQEKGKQCKLDVLCLVFAFICPFVSTILIQNKINMIVGKPE